MTFRELRSSNQAVSRDSFRKQNKTKKQNWNSNPSNSLESDRSAFQISFKARRGFDAHTNQSQEGRGYSWPQKFLAQGLEACLRLWLLHLCTLALLLPNQLRLRGSSICSRLFHILENSRSEMKGDWRNPGEGFWLTQSLITYCIIRVLKRNRMSRMRI